MSARRNRTFVAAWLIPLLIALAALALPASGLAALPGAISGTVTGEGAGGLSGVLVCAWEEEEGFEECAKSKPGGGYEITPLPAGEYVVEFWPGGQNFIKEFYDNTRKYEAATLVTVTAGATKSGIDAELEIGSMITGLVTAAATGQAAPEVRVCAFSTTDFLAECAKTDATGHYTIVGLEAGQYELEFDPVGNGQGLLWQLYPGLVTVPAKGTKSGVNQALPSGGQIRGTVRLAATGAPLGGVRVCLTEAEFLEQWACLTSPASGLYGFIGLPQGSYKVAFSAAGNEFPDPEPIVDAYPTQWWKGASAFATATAIAVTPPAIVDGVDAALGPPPVPPVTPVSVLPTTPVKTKPLTKPIKCRKGTVKRKVHGKTRCVRRHKAAKHKPPHKKHS